jgi:hypothetical protein
MYSDLKSKFRDFKLNLISGDYEFKISTDAINRFRTELTFIKSQFKDDIITGSLALNLWGLIDRITSDIDILIEDSNRYTGYVNTGYGDDEFGLISNRLGYLEFNWKKNFFSKRRYYEVDFFKNDGVKFHEFNFDGTLLKIQDPLDIISFKMDLVDKLQFYRTKHERDLFTLFNSVYLLNEIR